MTWQPISRVGACAASLFLLLCSRTDAESGSAAGASHASESEQGAVKPPNDKVLCGAYCVFVALRALDYELDSVKTVIETMGPPSDDGYSLQQLAQFAEQQGAYTLGLQTHLEGLRRQPGRFACIAHLKAGHFVVVANVVDEGVIMIDPPGYSTIPATTFGAQWDGTALLIARDAAEVSSSIEFDPPPAAAAPSESSEVGPANRPLAAPQSTTISSRRWLLAAAGVACLATAGLVALRRKQG